MINNINNKKKKDKRLPTTLVILMVGFGLIGGIIIGMVIQQMVLTASAVEIGESLSGSNFTVNVNINETKIIEGFNKTTQYVVEAIKQSTLSNTTK